MAFTPPTPPLLAVPQLAGDLPCLPAQGKLELGARCRRGCACAWLLPPATPPATPALQLKLLRGGRGCARPRLWPGLRRTQDGRDCPEAWHHRGSCEPLASQASVQRPRPQPAGSGPRWVLGKHSGRIGGHRE